MIDKILLLFSFLLFPIGFFASKFIVVPCVAIALLLVLRVYALRYVGKFELFFELRQRPYLWAVLVFLLYAGASVLWATEFQFSLTHYISLFFLMFAGMSFCLFPLADGQRTKMLRALLYGSFLSHLLMALMVVTDFKYFFPHFHPLYQPLFHHANFVSLSALFVWPLAVYMWRSMHKSLSLIYVMLSLYSFWGVGNDASILAFFAGAGFFLCVYCFRNSFIRFIQLVTVGVFLFAPVLAMYTFDHIIHPYYISQDNELIRQIKPSMLHRFHIWNYVSKKIELRPIQGYGMFSARFFPDAKDVTCVLRPKKGDLQEKPLCYDNLTLHPHNMFLQIWLEAGFLGALFASVFLFLMFDVIIAIKNRLQQGVAFTVLTSVLLIGNLSYGVWQSWWLSSIFLVGFFVLKPNGLFSEKKEGSSG